MRERDRQREREQRKICREGKDKERCAEICVQENLKFFYGYYSAITWFTEYLFLLFSTSH